MAWYQKHIEHGDDVRRPYVKCPRLSVHRILSLLDDASLPQEVVQSDNAIHRMLSDLNTHSGDSGITVSGSGDDRDELTITHVEAAIEFARDHPDLIREIQQEQQAIDTAVLTPSPEESHELLQSMELTHFDVDSTLEERNGDFVLQYDIE